MKFIFNFFDQTPLYQAISNGSFETVKLLLSHPNIDVNCKNSIHLRKVYLMQFLVNF